MEKIILRNKTEIEIKPGASLGDITAVVADFTELGNVADTLKLEGNLDAVQFTSDGTITGEYTDMKLIAPMFRGVDVREYGITASFALEEKTEIEKRLDRIETSQHLQEGAIEELGEVVSTLAEGGMV